jgi:hypothetical protein
MTDDLVKRLRGETEWTNQKPYFHAHTKCLEAADRIEALTAENEKLREALRVYSGPMEWTQEGGWGVFPVWADGYPGGVYLDDNTLDFGDAARAALQETDETFTHPDNV